MYLSISRCSSSSSSCSPPSSAFQETTPPGVSQINNALVALVIPPGHSLYKPGTLSADKYFSSQSKFTACSGARGHYRPFLSALTSSHRHRVCCNMSITASIGLSQPLLMCWIKILHVIYDQLTMHPSAWTPLFSWYSIIYATFYTFHRVHLLYPTLFVSIVC